MMLTKIKERIKVIRVSVGVATDLFDRSILIIAQSYKSQVFLDDVISFAENIISHL
jgi:hypothetical protein